MKKRKQLAEIGRFKIGQLVQYQRPDSTRIWAEEIEIGDWPYLKDNYQIARIELCESGALLWLKNDAGEISAHLNLSIGQGEPAMPEPCSSITIIQHVPRQMEIPA